MRAPDRRCPTCKGIPAPRGDNDAWPFCSDRCRLCDLGRWIGEAYRIPGERVGDGTAVRPVGEEDGTT